MELEEVYQDVVDMTEAERKTELETFAQADGYIFPTKLLNDKINSGKKPYTIILGTYHVEQEITDKFNDGKTHVVYAGTFDPRKGGAAAAAAAAAAFIPDNYVFHICGFGSPKEIADVKAAVDKVNKVTPGKAVYHGTLTGKTYISLIQSCHIGLSTQNPNAQFNATSFPSKILSYMSNGLDVVTVDIPAVRNSAVGKYLYYYQHQTPEEIAKAITQVKNNGHNNKDIIFTLHQNFVNDIDSLMKRFFVMKLSLNLKSRTNQNLLANILGSYVIKGLGILCSLISMPLFIQYFNNQMVLGVWFTMLSVLNWILVFDMGIGNGLRNHLTKALAANDFISARKLVSSAYIMLGLWTIIISIICCGLAVCIDWNVFLNISTNVISPDMLSHCVIVCILGVLLSFFLRIISSVIYSIQRSAITNLISF